MEAGESGAVAEESSGASCGDENARAEGIRVFVYGSLKRGFGNHRLLADAKFISEHSLTGPYTMVSLGGFPGVVCTPGHERTIHGELYVVDQTTLDSLDLLEGHPHFYERRKIVQTPYKRAWIYLLSEGYCRGNNVVESGNWGKGK